jgi:LysM repeat protein
VRVWTKSACAVLAWGSILLIVAVASGVSQTARPAQANIRIASSTTEITRASPANVAVVLVMAPRPVKGYVVQPDDTLSGIAARLAVRGGWPALYAANRPRIGPDPDVIRPGTVLVLPGRKAPARYTVADGDTLSAIAVALAVRGGWPALYAANRRVIGPDPGQIRPGTVLAIPHPAAPSPAGSRPGHRVPPPPPSAPAGGRPGYGHGHGPGTAAPATGMPGWLKTVLLAAGLIGAALLTEPMLLARRRRRQRAGARAAQPVAAGPGPGAGGPGADRAGIVVADHDRLVVTRSQPDDTVYVLRPPGQDPREILRVARLVLPEALYGELADLLGVPASWPMRYDLPAQAGPAGPWRLGQRAVPEQRGSPRRQGRG